MCCTISSLHQKVSPISSPCSPPYPSAEIKRIRVDQPLHASWPERSTLRDIVTRRLDVFSVPRRSFFEWLSFFTTNPDETEKLQYFCSSEGQVRAPPLSLVCLLSP
jgi:sulfite reductase alpha subunit-like flavoprotein